MNRSAQPTASKWRNQPSYETESGLKVSRFSQLKPKFVKLVEFNINKSCSLRHAMSVRRSSGKDAIADINRFETYAQLLADSNEQISCEGYSSAYERCYLDSSYVRNKE